jgi:hypothetical protein
VLVSFPTGDSQADKSARLNAASVTLQNLNGPGKGCPVVSTTFPLQQKAIDAGTDLVSTPSLSVTQPAPSSTPSNPVNVNANNGGSLDDATIRSLAPELGFQSGVNPTGTGDCDGAVDGADGKPIKVPCSCPPPQDVYLDVRCSLSYRVPCSGVLLLFIGTGKERSGGNRCEQPFSQSFIPN